MATHDHLGRRNGTQIHGATHACRKDTIVLSAGIVVLVFMSVYVTAQLNASGKAMESMLGIPYVQGVWLSLGLVLMYAMVGGTRSVSWTNLVQASMMIVALIAMPILVLVEGNLFGSLFETLRSLDPSLVSATGGFSGWGAASLIAGWLFLGIAVPGMPHVLRRFIASSSEKSVITQGGFISIVWSQTVFIGAITLGMAARAFSPEMLDPEQALPSLAVELLPGFLAGFMLAAVWAAISSTADSQLVEAVSAVTEDFPVALRRWFSKGKAERISQRPFRILMILIGIGTAVFASSENRQIFALVLDAWNILGAALAPPVLMMLLYKRTSGAGILAGILTGALTVFIWRYIVQITWLSPLVPGFILSSLSIIVGSWLFPED